MSEVKESIEVDVPVRTAYNQWTQFETFPLFMDGVRRVEQVDETLTHWVTKIGGVDREFDAEITEQVPNERIAWVTVGGEAEQSGVVTFHPVDPNRTEVTLRLAFDPDGLAETIADKFGFIDRQVTGDLQRFKKFVEERGSESGAWRGEVWPRPSPRSSGGVPFVRPGSTPLNQLRIVEDVGRRDHPGGLEEDHQVVIGEGRAKDPFAVLVAQRHQAPAGRRRLVHEDGRALHVSRVPLAPVFRPVRRRGSRPWRAGTPFLPVCGLAEKLPVWGLVLRGEGTTVLRPGGVAGPSHGSGSRWWGRGHVSLPPTLRWVPRSRGFGRSGKQAIVDAVVAVGALLVGFAGQRHGHRTGAVLAGRQSVDAGLPALKSPTTLTGPGGMSASRTKVTSVRSLRGLRSSLEGQY